MRLQTIILGLFTISTLSTAGFFDNDKAYYALHLEAAKEKIKSCKKELAIARIDEEREKVMALRKDQECKDAFDVIKEDKQKVRQVKYAIEKKKRAEEKAKKDAQYKIDYKKQLALQKKIPYEDFIKIKNSCRVSFGIPTAECKVYDELKHTRKEQAIKELMTKYQGDALRAYKKKTCHRKNAFSSVGINCDIAVDAAQKNEEEIIAKLSSDKESFKKVYNECSKQIVPLRKKMKWEKINKITQSFKCSTALTAARNYHIMGFGTLVK